MENEFARLKLTTGQLHFINRAVINHTYTMLERHKDNLSAETLAEWKETRAIINEAIRKKGEKLW